MLVQYPVYDRYWNLFVTSHEFKGKSKDIWHNMRTLHVYFIGIFYTIFFSIPNMYHMFWLSVTRSEHPVEFFPSKLKSGIQETNWHVFSCFFHIPKHFFKCSTKSIHYKYNNINNIMALQDMYLIKRTRTITSSELATPTRVHQ